LLKILVFGRHAAKSAGNSFDAVVVGVGGATKGIYDALTVESISNYISTRSQDIEKVMLDVTKLVAKQLSNHSVLPQ